MMADAWSNVKIPTILLPYLGRYDEDFKTAIDDREKRCRWIYSLIVAVPCIRWSAPFHEASKLSQDLMLLSALIISCIEPERLSRDCKKRIWNS